MSCAAPRLGRDFFARGTVAVARALLGQHLVRVEPCDRRTVGRVVETEAYLGPEDRAAHTFNYRKTERTAAMWMAPGTAYVFLTYGMHHCLNVSTVSADVPQAVLLRALEPVEGMAQMHARRPKSKRLTDLCSGPAKLTQALDIDRGFDRADLTTCPTLFFERARKRGYPESQIAATPRVGVDYAGDWAARPLRFCLRGSPHVSRPWPD
ncbi:MAG: DNA-3-methyladenine glycosylase [Planctomycetota bacterium]